MDPFDAAITTLVDMIGGNAPDNEIELRARSISLAFGPHTDDIVALAMTESAMVEHELRAEFLRAFPDFCKRR